MKRTILLFTLACLILTGSLSCHSGHEAVAHKTSKQPKFINNVSIAPHNSSNVTVNAIDHKKYPQKQKPVPNTPHSAPVAMAAKGPDITTIKPGTSPVIPNTLRKKYADIIGVNPKDISNYSLYQFIDKWYGANYRLGGCDASGIDCSGFAQKLYGDVYGIDLLRTATEQFRDCKRIKSPHDAEEGDLVFFNIRGKRISHVGVYLANNFFVHASTSNGVMISSLTEDYWHKYYVGCGRIPRG